LDELLFERLEIIDDGPNDWMEKHHEGNISYFINGEALGRSRLRFDHCRWSLSKLAAKRFGDRTALELSGHVSLSEMSEEDIRAELAALVHSGVIPVDLVALDDV